MAGTYQSIGGGGRTKYNAKRSPVTSNNVTQHKPSSSRASSLLVQVARQAAQKPAAFVEEGLDRDTSRVVRPSVTVAKAGAETATVVAAKVAYRTSEMFVVRQVIKNGVSLNGSSSLASGIMNKTYSVSHSLQMPKNIVRNVVNLAITPVRDSDVGRGYSLASNIYHLQAAGVRTSVDLTKKTVNITRNTVRSAQNITTFVKAVSRGDFTKAEFARYFSNATLNQLMSHTPIAKHFYKPLVNDPIHKFIKDVEFKKHVSINDRFVQKFFRKCMSDIQKQAIEHWSHSQSVVLNQFASHLTNVSMAKSMEGKLGLRSVGHVNTRMTQINQTIDTSKVVGSAIKSGVKKASDAVKAKMAAKKAAKGAKGAAKGAEKGVKATLKIVKAAVKSVVKLTKLLITTLASLLNNPIGWIILAIILVVIILFILFAVIVSNMEDQKKTVDLFTQCQTDDATEKNIRVLDELKKCHNEQQKEIDEMLQKYPTADVQFPDGAQENYAEIWSAIVVESQGNIGYYPDDDLEELADSLYKMTHKLSYAEYSYKTLDGSSQTANHVYLNILRGESLAYENIAGAFVNKAGELVDTSVADINATCASDDWMAIVKTVKAATAAAKIGYYGDANLGSASLPLNINGTTYYTRTDCSGFVSTCLQVYGSLAQGSVYSSYDFRDAGGFPGFVKMAWPGYAGLHPGDIMAKGGHVEVFAYASNGRNYVYSNGTTSCVNSPGVSSDRAVYDVIFRPVAPGSGADVSVEGGAQEGQTGAGINADQTPMTSNMPELNKETMCEDGYEETLKQDLASALENGYAYTYDGTLSINISSANKKRSSADFVRYILAKHGAKLSMNPESMFLGDAIHFSPNKMKAGDVLFYIPHTLEADALYKALPDPIAKGSVVMTIDGLGEVNVQETLQANSVPMIADGSGNLVYFGRDVTLDQNGYPASEAKVYSVPLSSLNSSRIYFAEYVTNLVTKPIWGSTDFFEGWTDENIKSLMTLIDAPCWSTKVVDLTGYELGNMTQNDYSNIDWSWYDNGNFKSDGEYWNVYTSDEHVSGFREDLIKELYRYYDQYGVLPGAGYAVSKYLTHDRSTQESLANYNFWELEAEGTDVDKYSYDDSGNVEVRGKKYKSYDSFKEAIEDFGYTMGSLVGGRKDPNNRADVDTATNEGQIDGMYEKGLISKEVHDKAIAWLKDNDLSETTAGAKRRRALGEDVASYSIEGIQKMDAINGAAYPTLGQYTDLINTINGYTESADKFNAELNAFDSRTVEAQSKLNTYNSQAKNMLDAAESAYQRYLAAPASMYPDGYDCPLEGRVPNEVCSKGQTHTIHKQEWPHLSATLSSY